MDDRRVVETTTRRRPTAGVQSSIFPLPVSPLERYLIVEDSESHPMAFFVELVFSTSLNQEALTEALRLAVHAHPLLSSRLKKRGREWAWHYDSNYVPVWKTMQETPLLDGDGNPVPIDLERECGGRYWYEATEPESRLWIQVHHACCDALGLRQFLIDLTTEYARRTAPESLLSGWVASSKRKAEILLKRFSLESFRAHDSAAKLSTRERLKNLYYFLWLTPQPLKSSYCRLGNPPDGHWFSMPSPDSVTANRPYLVQNFDPETSKRIVDRARQGGINLSDLSLALMFQTCRQWNREHLLGDASRRLRVMFPVDLRDRSTYRMSAANQMSFAFVGRTHSQCDHWEELLAGIQRETRWIKDKRVYADLLFSLEALASRTWLLKQIVRRNRNLATAVLTYSGDIFRGLRKHFPNHDLGLQVGDAIMTRVTSAPPVRANTNIACAFFACGDQLFLSANWSRSAFTEVDCRAFLHLYSELFRHWSAFGTLPTFGDTPHSSGTDIENTGDTGS